LLSDKGWQVSLYASGAPGTPEAKVNAAAWAKLSDIHDLERFPTDKTDLAAFDIVFDSLLGNGLTRPFERYGAQQAALAEAQLSDLGPRIVAIDVPSGLCADSGRVLGADGANLRDSIHADLTVTFETLCPGHLLADGPEVCGTVRVVPLGRAVAHARDKLSGPNIVDRIFSPAAEDLRKSQNAHKYSHGHVAVVTGGVGRTGAARLSARAALRTGAGAVTLAAPPDAMTEVACQITSEMVRAIDGPQDLIAMLADPRFRTTVLGPGCGTGPREGDMLAALLDQNTATVLDADALTLIARSTELQNALHDKCVLTPHDGEFARLCPDLSDRLKTTAFTGPAYSRLDAARAAALRFGTTLVLKGPATIVAAPDGRSKIHGGPNQQAPWLATAGSGDVLAGMIAGLMARGRGCADAACDAAWLHAEAGRGFGAGLIAEDLPEALPGVFRTLGV
jgi:ADP-dependent NAD(P)H-hydrate dehydratase / NAD(P)H-hydrate epimerase